DLAYQYLEPEAYKTLLARVETKREAATTYIEKIKGTLLEKLKAAGLEAEVEGRLTPLSSLQQKLKRQRIDLEQVYDFMALRVVVASIPDCYAVLGILHNLWRPVPGRLHELLALPPPNASPA